MFTHRNLRENPNVLIHLSNLDSPLSTPAIIADLSGSKNLNLAYVALGQIKGLSAVPSLVIIRHPAEPHLAIWLLDRELSQQERARVAQALKQRYGVTVLPQDTELPVEDCLWKGSHDQGHSAVTYCANDMLNVLS
jgi:hypothetical protein